MVANYSAAGLPLETIWTDVSAAIGQIVIAHGIMAGRGWHGMARHGMTWHCAVQRGTLQAGLHPADRPHGRLEGLHIPPAELPSARDAGGGGPRG